MSWLIFILYEMSRVGYIFLDFSAGRGGWLRRCKIERVL